MTRYMFEITNRIRQSHGSWAPLFIADICRHMAYQLDTILPWSKSEHACLLAISEIGDIFSSAVE
jgi:hypothetical protein